MELEVDQAKLNFETHGNPNNSPLVLWHGAGCTLRMWDNVISGLVGKFYVVTFDIRGAGKSLNFDESEDAFSFEKYSEDLNHLLSHLKIGKFNLWSMAWGTRAALAYSFLNSDKILSAVFSDASIASADVEAQRKGLKKAMARQELMGIQKFELPKGWNEHINKKNAELSLTAAAKFNLDKAVSSISYPFLVMTGDHDPNLTSSKDIVNRSASGNLKILDDVGHGSVLQRPDLVLENFLSWHNLEILES